MSPPLPSGEVETARSAVRVRGSGSPGEALLRGRSAGPEKEPFRRGAIPSPGSRACARLGLSVRQRQGALPPAPLQSPPSPPISGLPRIGPLSTQVGQARLAGRHSRRDGPRLVKAEIGGAGARSARGRDRPRQTPLSATGEQSEPHQSSDDGRTAASVLPRLLSGALSSSGAPHSQSRSAVVLDERRDVSDAPGPPTHATRMFSSHRRHP